MTKNLAVYLLPFLVLAASAGCTADGMPSEVDDGEERPEPEATGADIRAAERHRIARRPIAGNDTARYPLATRPELGPVPDPWCPPRGPVPDPWEPTDDR